MTIKQATAYMSISPGEYLIGFINDNNNADETELFGMDKKDLEDVYEEFCNENRFSTDTVLYVISSNLLPDSYNKRMVSLEWRKLRMNKQEFLNYIIDYAICTGWEDCNGKDQIRALFTSWCLIFHIDADTKECDDTLNVIYWRAAMEELIEYEDYEQFMIEFIV